MNVHRDGTDAVSKAPLRREDIRFITGHGRYTDDIRVAAKPMPRSSDPITRLSRQFLSHRGRS